LHVARIQTQRKLEAINETIKASTLAFFWAKTSAEFQAKEFSASLRAAFAREQYILALEWIVILLTPAIAEGEPSDQGQKVTQVAADKTQGVQAMDEDSDKDGGDDDEIHCDDDDNDGDAYKDDGDGDGDDDGDGNGNEDDEDEGGAED
jgi:hypothetical protein